MGLGGFEGVWSLVSVWCGCELVRCVRCGFASPFRTGLRCAVGRGSLLVVAECSGFLATSAPYGSRPASRYQAASLLLWSGFVRLDTDCPVSLATPADAARNPEHNTTIGKKDPPKDMVTQAVPHRRTAVPPYRRAFE